MNARKALCKFTASAAIALLLVGGIVWPAHANNRDFTLYNQRSQSIRQLFVAPSGAPSWGADVLGTGVLRSGHNTYITFPNQLRGTPCIFDIKAVHTDGSVVVNRGFNLCAVDFVLLY